MKWGRKANSERNKFVPVSAEASASNVRENYDPFGGYTVEPLRGSNLASKGYTSLPASDEDKPHLARVKKFPSWVWVPKK